MTTETTVDEYLPRAVGPFRPTADVVSNCIGGETVLLHMRTGRIFRLNRTTSRVWELLIAGNDQDAIRRTISEEFGVGEVELASELQGVYALLQQEGLIEAHTDLCL
jgi:hypothetical protein